MPSLDQIRIGVSPLSDRIYLGTVSKKDPSLWVNKVDATSQFIGNLLAWVEPGATRLVTSSDGSEYEIEVRRTKTPNAGNKRCAASD